MKSTPANIHFSDIIVAQCTPRGSGALAIIRLSGSETIALADRICMLPKNKILSEQPSHTIHFGWVVDDHGSKIDQVMISVLRAPATFTGEDIIEITGHNNQFLVNAIIEQAIVQGARLAREGEFAQRAFMNDKIDLIQAEALNDLIHGQTQHALKKSLAQLEGTFSYWTATIELELIRALAWCEASFEYLDEEREFSIQIKAHLQKLLSELHGIKKSFDIHKQIRQGIRIAFIGAVNAGKSSLFNALLGERRAIVTEIAGTTRDVIESGMYRNGTYWTLIDTAGIRTTNDIVESEGVQRSRQEAHKADIIVLVFDSSRAPNSEELSIYTELLNEYPNKIIMVHNKSDLPTHASYTSISPALRISCNNGSHISALLSAIDTKTSQLLSMFDSPFLLNDRQYKLLLSLEYKLNNILAQLNSSNIHYELVSHNIREALEHLTELTGKSISESGMDMVFKEFCVGK